MSPQKFASQTHLHNTTRKIMKRPKYLNAGQGIKQSEPSSLFLHNDELHLEEEVNSPLLSNSMNTSKTCT